MVIMIIVAAVIKKIAATSAQNTLEINISNNHTHTPLFFLNFLAEFFNSSSRKALYVIDNLHMHTSAVSLFTVFVFIVTFDRAAIFGTHMLSLG